MTETDPTQALSEAPGAYTPPDAAAVAGWQGYPVDDIDGNGAGKVSGFFVDSKSGRPAWLLVKLGRFGGDIAIPLHDCAAVAGKVWVPYDGETLREAPTVDPTRPLNREQEQTICRHFGVVTTHGRAAEVASRKEGEITSHPLNG